MIIPRWIDCDNYSTHVGDIGYLVHVNNSSTRRESWVLHDQPARTNQGREPRLDGWCRRDE